MRITETTIALLFFELRAREIAQQLGFYETRVRTCTGYVQGTVYYCEYRLPGSEQWQESPEAENISDALTNLKQALTQRLTDSVSQN